MSSRSRRTAAERLRGEEGSALIIVIFVSMLLMSMVTLLLATGANSERSSARSKNFDVALSVAEAGVHDAIAKIDANNGSFTGSVSGSVPQGAYSGTVTRVYGKSYTVEMTGTVTGEQFGRERKVKVTLEAPSSFAYALFSDTSVELKNLDEITGDIWANDSVFVEQNDVVTGSVTAAQSWVLMKQGSRVTGDVWSGGFHSNGWAVRLENGAQIGGDAKASVSDPSTTCPTGGNYEVEMYGSASVSGDLTTCDTATATPGGAYSPNTYTQAATPRTLPGFTFNPSNYDPATYQSFSSVSAFQTWLGANKTNLQGTFYVSEPSPSQTNRIDLTGAKVVGDTTIVTNAPVFTNGITDSSNDKTFVLVSHYQPPTATACDVNHDSSECAVHVKNNFDASCATAVLIYADLGPVAVKNNQKMCGAIYADSILIKNNQQLTYDPRIERIVGFGSRTYEVTRWEELDA